MSEWKIELNRTVRKRCAKVAEILMKVSCEEASAHRINYSLIIFLLSIISVCSANMSEVVAALVEFLMNFSFNFYVKLQRDKRLLEMIQIKTRGQTPRRS